jgi:hypothetical protein
MGFNSVFHYILYHGPSLILCDDSSNTVATNFASIFAVLFYNDTA